MRKREPLAYSNPLDLLRRFVPTPLKANYLVGHVQVTVQTNDFTLLPALPLGASLDVQSEQTLEWKLVRDADSHGNLEEPMWLRSGMLTIVEMGPTCLLGLDFERRELLGFIGAAVDARTYQEYLVPMLCRMTKEAHPRLAIDGSGNKNEGADDE
jgi:hypothetical protein